MNVAEMEAERDAIMEIPWRDRSDEQKERWQELRREITKTHLAKLGDGIGVLVYDSNNSGGSWWLSDKVWQKLADAGWSVHWVRPNPDPNPRFASLKETLTGVYSDDPTAQVEGDFGSYEWAKDHRWLGAVATSCAKAGPDPNELLREWEEITGQDSADEGCNCCGRPHNFEWHDPETGESRSPRTETTYVQHGF